MTTTPSFVAAAATSTLLLAADGSRTSVTIENTSPATMYVAVGFTPATTSGGGFTFSRPLNAGATLTPPEAGQALYAIWTSAAGGGATITAVSDPTSDSNGAGITTYAQLKTAVAAWLRPNSAVSSDMSTNIPKYIGLGEVAIRRELHLRRLDQAVSSLAITDGTATVPDGFLSVVSLSLVDEPYNQLTGLALDQVRAAARISQATKPRHYAVSGGLFYFDFDGDATAELIHRRGVTPLVNDNDTNWILAGHPDLLLSASLVVAAQRLIDPRLGEFKEWFAQSLDSVQRLERNLHSDIILPMPNGMVV